MFRYPTTNPLRLLWDARRARLGGEPAIARRRTDRLAALVAHARDRSPFYRRLYSGLPETVTDVETLPVTDKTTLMANFDDWLCTPHLTSRDVRDFVDDASSVGRLLDDRFIVTTTSGTTGVGGVFIQDDHARAVTAAMAARMVGSLVSPGDVVKILRDGRRTAFVVPHGGHFASTTAATRMSTGRDATVKVFSVHEPLPTLVEGLNRFRPAVLLPYATTGALLAAEAEAGRLRIDPALVMLSAEGLAPSEYDRIGRAFDAPVGHSWAANEVPFLSYNCHHRWLHVNADWVIAEPVDADHRPVPKGRTSHTVLVTNLANRVQPILRYDLGDSVLMRPDPCECGDPLPAVRVQGRAAEVLTFDAPTGRPVTITPLVLTTLIERVPGVELFQVLQTAPTVLRIRLRPASGRDPEAVWTAVRTDLTGLLASHGLPHVAVEPAPEPPQPTTGGKYRTVIPLPR
ncbi:phenylacetate-coenzyme A ligase PaaK-like adenylate-forming protein [Stackebrandtia albiflava]|uniref:Phenylacetate-coenzyme A ligase PaaK-like adenylate-forming protein n=1 Tax=Stackebrandtia albiflava TaxID=406432 RepID=A0A562URJ0_9ACTN|nr:phenylacetate--CoA ligase family protein [Stackebrandtia albiflava]TWJ08232.1 phenylacetate-coenzyme A ligase PaaK-like adenylate-forming protein [Stackebrandtia albiflava]